MLNLLKISIRKIIARPIHTLINIGGLAVGIASSILLFCWVADELSYDTYQANYNDVYKILHTQKVNDEISTGDGLPYNLKEALLAKTTKIKKTVITSFDEGSLLSHQDHRVTKFGIAATAEFFEIFSYHCLKGKLTGSLESPTGIVITESTEKALFGNEDGLNQVIRINNNDDLKVVAIVSDPPMLSSIKFDYVLPFSFYEKTNRWIEFAKSSWDDSSFQIYCLSQSDIDPKELQREIVTLLWKNNPKLSESKLIPHPMSRWHLYSNFQDGKNVGGLVTYVILCTVVGFFILAITLINFVNITTAHAESRSKEIGLKKCLGSERRHIIFQVLGETFVKVSLAYLIALLIVFLAIPYYNSWIGKHISRYFSAGLFWGYSLIGIIIITFFASIYPARLLSAVPILSGLKGEVFNLGDKGRSRKFLLTFQYAISILLCSSTLIISQQIEYTRDRDIGYNRDNLIQVWMNGEMQQNFSTIRQELLQTGVVESVCKSNSPITSVLANTEVSWPGKGNDHRVAFNLIATEYDFLKTMGIKIIEGRDFSRDFPSDSTSAIINETAARLISSKSIIGSKVHTDVDLKIIGVVSDVVMDSPFKPVQPMIIVFNPMWSSTATLRLSAEEKLPVTLHKIEEVFKKLNPNYPFQYRFTDDDFQKKFQELAVIQKLSTLFSFVAISIMVLGIFGLVTFMISRRKRELSVRWVFGASSVKIICLLCKEFSILVLIAMAIATCIGWFAMNKFLVQFPYRIHPGLLSWIGFGALVFILTVVVIIKNVASVVLKNPTLGLKGD